MRMWPLPVHQLAGVAVGTTVISYSVTYSCGVVSALKTVTVNPSSGIVAISGLDSVCQGATITLTDGTAGGVWSSGNTNATVSGGVVTGVAAGTAPISYSVVSSSCGTISAVSVITIEPSASAGIGPISSLSIVCIGSGHHPCGPYPGGTWVASNSNAVVVGAGIIDGVTEGAVTISYVVSNSCGTGAATKLLAVDTIPIVAPVTGATSQCLGGTITLSDPTAGGIWTTSTPAVGTVGVSSGIVTGFISRRNNDHLYSNECVWLPRQCHISRYGNASLCNNGHHWQHERLRGRAGNLKQCYGRRRMEQRQYSHRGYRPGNGYRYRRFAGTATVIYTIVNSCGYLYGNRHGNSNGAAGSSSHNGGNNRLSRPGGNGG